MTIHFKGLIFVVFARISKKAHKKYWQSISKVSSLSFWPASQKTLRKINDNPFQKFHLCRFRPNLKKRSEKLLTIHFKSLIFVVFARISKNAQKNYWQSISKVSSLSFLPASQKTLRKITDNPFQKSHLCRFCPHLKKRSEKLLTIHFKSLIFVVFARISKNAQKIYWQSISKASSLSFLPASQKTLRKITDNPFQKSHFVVFARISKNAQKNYWQSISKVSSLSFLPASQKTLRKITDNPFQRSRLCRFCPHLKKRSEKLLTIHFKSLIFVVFARISKTAQKIYWQSISKVSSLSFLPASQKTLRKTTDNPFQRSHLCRFCPHLKKRSEKLLTIHFKISSLSFLPASQKTLRKTTDNPFQKSHIVVFVRISKNAQENYWQSLSKVSSLSFLPSSQKTLRKITDNPFQKSHLCRFCPHLQKRSERLLTIHFKSLIFVVFARISKNAQKNYWQSISEVSSLSFSHSSQETLRKSTDNPFQRSHLCRFCPHLKKRSKKLLTIHFKSLIFVVFARISKKNERN